MPEVRAVKAIGRGISWSGQKSLKLTRDSLKALQSPKGEQAISGYLQHASTEELGDFVQGLWSQPIVRTISLNRLTPTSWKVFWTEVEN